MSYNAIRENKNVAKFPNLHNCKGLCVTVLTQGCNGVAPDELDT